MAKWRGNAPLGWSASATGSSLGAVSFAPDGCALDAEGHVWAANALGGVLCRVAPGGGQQRVKLCDRN